MMRSAVCNSMFTYEERAYSDIGNRPIPKCGQLSGVCAVVIVLRIDQQRT